MAVTLVHFLAALSVAAFMVGFASLLLFWPAHVRYRKLTHGVSARATILTLTLVFLVLIYVQPMRAMAQSLAFYMGVGDDPMPGNVGMLFSIYGVGFSLMALVTALLFRDGVSRANPDELSARRRLIGEMWVWIILAVTGIASFLLTLLPWPAPFFSPWLYSTLPIVIGVFSWRYQWVDAAPVEDEVEAEAATGSA